MSSQTPSHLNLGNTNVLRDEIAMLRKCLRGVVESTGTIQSFPEAIRFLRLVALGSASLSHLSRTQDASGSDESELTMQEAINKVARDLAIVDTPD